jgi:hypothetical protein
VAAKGYRIWPALEVLFKLYDNNPAFGCDELESTAEDAQKNILDSILHADKSGEVFTSDQAAAFVDLLMSEDLSVRYKEIQRSLQEAEKSGNLTLAMELMRDAGELRKRISRLSPG